MKENEAAFESDDVLFFLTLSKLFFIRARWKKHTHTHIISTQSAASVNTVCRAEYRTAPAGGAHSGYYSPETALRPGNGQAGPPSTGQTAPPHQFSQD